MKKIFKLSFLALVFSFTACEDAYDIIQDSELGEEAAFRTVDDLQSGLNAAYSAYSPDAASNGNGDAFLFSDLFTDNFKRGTSNGGQGIEEYALTINTNTNSAGVIWSGRYSCINRINRVLRNFDRVVGGASGNDISRADGIKAQLLALRALCHFDLFSYFTPDFKDPASPSVIIMNFVPSATETFPRNNAGDVLTFILSDLDEAGNLFAPGFQSEGSFYINQNAIAFLRARVLLFRGETADNSVIESLAENLLGIHPIITDPSDYESFWADTNLETVSEDVFTLFRGQNDNGVAGIFYANSTDAEGSPLFEMSNELYDLYDADDIRKVIFLDGTSVLSEPRILLINKYPGSGRGQLVNHIKLFRSSEMLLIKAEVEARQGKYDEAQASVQSLRAARYAGSTPTTPLYTSLQSALSDILLERRKELCYEGHRYLDLKRIGREINATVTRDNRDCSSFPGPCNILTSDYRFTLPIPRVEIDANPGILQNPNY